MSKALNRRLVSGISANAFNQLVTVVVQLINVPILLHLWGKDLYGEWLMLFAVPAYVSIIDLGLSQSAANDMTMRKSAGDIFGAIRTFQTTCVVVSALSVLGGMVVVSTLNILDVAEALNLEQISSVHATQALSYLCLAVLVGLPDGINHAGFRANRCYALHMWLYSLTRLAQYVSIWVSASLGAGVVEAALAFFVVRLISTFLNTWILMRMAPWLELGLRRASFATVKNLYKPALANVSIPLAQSFSLQGMVLVVGTNFGAIALVIFTTLRTLTRLALQGVLSVSHSVEPEIAVAIGRGDRSLARRLLGYSMVVSFLLSALTAIALAFLGEEVVAIWTGGVVDFDRPLFTWLLMASVLGAVWQSGFVALKAANKHLNVAMLYVAISVCAVVGAEHAASLSAYALSTAGVFVFLIEASMVIAILISLACRRDSNF